MARPALGMARTAAGCPLTRAGKCGGVRHSVRGDARGWVSERIYKEQMPTKVPASGINAGPKKNRGLDRLLAGSKKNPAGEAGLKF
jgi:hypothetical protein